MTLTILAILALVVAYPIVQWANSYGVCGTLTRLAICIHTMRDAYRFRQLQRLEMRKFRQQRRAEYEAAMLPEEVETQTVLEVR